MVRQASPQSHFILREALERAREKLHIQNPAEIYTHKAIRTPSIWCWRRHSVLLVPNLIGSHLDSSSWEGIFGHELAHFKRRDHISGLLSELILCVFPWHPLAWFAKHRLALLSEQACDDWVLASGHRGSDYAESLLHLIPQSQNVFAPCAASSRKGLVIRVHHILEERPGNPCIGLTWTLCVGLIVAMLIAGSSLAQTRSEGQVIPAMGDFQKTRIDYINKDFNDIYFLAEKQVVRYVPPPYSDERQDYLNRTHGFKLEYNIESATFWWHNGQLENGVVTVGYTPVDRTLKEVLLSNFKMNSYQIENSDSIPNIPLVGDWIIRKGTSLEQQLVGLSRCIKESVGSVITFEKKRVTREVLVVSSVHELRTQSGRERAVSVYSDSISDELICGGGAGAMSKFMNSLSGFLDVPIVNEVKDSNELVFSWIYYVGAQEIMVHSFQNPLIKKILANISTQVPIDFKMARQEVDVWSIKWGEAEKRESRNLDSTAPRRIR